MALDTVVREENDANVKKSMAREEDAKNGPKDDVKSGELEKFALPYVMDRK